MSIALPFNFEFYSYIHISTCHAPSTHIHTHTIQLNWVVLTRRYRWMVLLFLHSHTLTHRHRQYLLIVFFWLLWWNCHRICRKWLCGFVGVLNWLHWTFPFWWNKCTRAQSRIKTHAHRHACTQTHAPHINKLSYRHEVTVLFCNFTRSFQLFRCKTVDFSLNSRFKYRFAYFKPIQYGYRFVESVQKQNEDSKVVCFLNFVLEWFFFTHLHMNESCRKESRNSVNIFSTKQIYPKLNAHIHRTDKKKQTKQIRYYLKTHEKTKKK